MFRKYCECDGIHRFSFQGINKPSQNSHLWFKDQLFLLKFHSNFILIVFLVNIFKITLSDRPNPGILSHLKLTQLNLFCDDIKTICYIPPNVYNLINDHISKCKLKLLVTNPAKWYFILYDIYISPSKSHYNN